MDYVYEIFEDWEEKNNLFRAGLVFLGKFIVLFVGFFVGFFFLEIKKRREG